MNLETLCKLHGVKIQSVWADSNPNMDDMPQGSTHFKVTLGICRDGCKRQVTTFFSQGPAHYSTPKAWDVLGCLISDARSGDQDFESFCCDFGCDTDSRKAERAWKACAAMTPKIERFLGDLLPVFEQADY